MRESKKEKKDKLLKKMKAELTVTPEKRFEPITINIVLEDIEDTKAFYKAIGSMKASYPTDDIFKKLLEMYPESTMKIHTSLRLSVNSNHQ